MTLAESIFYFFLGACAASSLAILLSKNLFKAALWLLVCLMSVAALFVFSFAEFVAVAQILIYAAGVVVLIIFGIMLTARSSEKPLAVGFTNILSGTVLGTVLMAMLVKMIWHFEFADPKLLNTGRYIESIGVNLMTRFALPFEVVGILLLVTLIGAAAVTSILKNKAT